MSGCTYVVCLCHDIAICAEILWGAIHVHNFAVEPGKSLPGRWRLSCRARVAYCGVIVVLSSLVTRVLLLQTILGRCVCASYCNFPFITGCIRYILRWRAGTPFLLIGLGIRAGATELHSVSQLPPNAHRTVAWIDDEGTLIHTGSSRCEEAIVEEASNLMGVVKSFGEEWTWTTEHLDCTGEEADLATALQEGTAIAVADGSLKNKKGTAAFCILNPARDIVTGANETPGSSAVQCSYRSELVGILGILVACRAIWHRYDI